MEEGSTLNVGGTFSHPVSVQADSFAGLRTHFFRLPKWTEDQQTSRNLLGLGCWVEIVEAASLID